MLANLGTNHGAISHRLTLNNTADATLIFVNDADGTKQTPQTLTS